MIKDDVKALEARVEALEQVAVKQHSIIIQLVSMIEPAEGPQPPVIIDPTPKLIGIGKPN